jgi:CheY-like chemotaxis protein
VRTVGDSALRRTILILEDNEERIRNFRTAVESLGPDFRLRLWCDAPGMIEECLPLLSECCLISLDHDLHPMPGAMRDPGRGLDVAELLARQPPVCPVIIHTSHTERRWSMHNEFHFGKWNAEIVLPIGINWIMHSWLPRARALIGT